MATNCTCSLTPHLWNIFGLELCNGPLIGAWLLAVFIGTAASYILTIRKSSSIGSLSYSITYFTYALMISSGFVVHCLFYVECKAERPTPLFMSFARLDVSLTSCIAVSFFFNGLIDLELMSEKNKAALLLMGVSYCSVFIAYFVVDISKYLDLYFYSIIFGCGLYVAMELVQIVVKRYWLQFTLLFVGGVIGGVSLVAFEFENCWLACTFGAWSIEGVWYYGSDLSMIFVFLFVLSTRSSNSEKWKERIV